VALRQVFIDERRGFSRGVHESNDVNDSAYRFVDQPIGFANGDFANCRIPVLVDDATK
jgi:hypothetical protein